MWVTLGKRVSENSHGRIKNDEKLNIPEKQQVDIDK